MSSVLLVRANKGQALTQRDVPGELLTVRELCVRAIALAEKLGLSQPAVSISVKRGRR